MADADLTLVVLDASEPLTPDDEALLSRAARRIVVANKIDLASNVPEDALGVSALTGEGIEALRDAIIAAIAPEIEQRSRLHHQRPT